MSDCFVNKNFMISNEERVTEKTFPPDYMEDISAHVNSNDNSCIGKHKFSSE